MAASSSSSSSISNEKNYYHVFISSRGEDTRRNFTSHLCTALSNKHIKIYVDEDIPEKGDEISPSLLKAIEESKISVIVLSENYASSSRCLDELNHILRCKETTDQIVLPIFYYVDPSNVRHQSGSLLNAFAAHEERFKQDLDKVHHWRKSLTDVANLSWYHISTTGSDTESALIEKIVEDIINKLNGIEKNLRELNLLPSKSLLTLIDVLSAHVFFTSRNIKCLCLSDITIEEVPLSIECLSFLTKLWLDECTRLKTLPTNIFKLKSLESLSLCGCSKFEYFPEILEPMERLQELNLRETRIKELPLSIEKLTSLKFLYLENCEMLEIIPHTICNLHSLECFYVCGCKKLESLPELPFSLKRLDATGCSSLKKVSNSLNAFTQGPPVDFVEQELIFCSCFELDDENMVTEFYIKVLWATISKRKEFKSNRFPGVGICFPGAEIPEWFNSRSEGSLVNIKLDVGWYNDNFMGFALCAVFSFGIETNDIIGDLVCEMCFKTEHGESQTKIQTCIEYVLDATSERVVMRFVDLDYGDVSGAVEVSFKFRHKFSGDELNNEEVYLAERCGVRKLHVKDVKKLRDSLCPYLHDELNSQNLLRDRIPRNIDFDTDELLKKKKKKI